MVYFRIWIVRPTLSSDFLATTLDAGRNQDLVAKLETHISHLSATRFRGYPSRTSSRVPRESTRRASWCEDIAAVSPETTVRLHQIEFGDPWDFERVYETLFSFARSYPFDTDAEDYLVHITTGTHVAQICLFLLTESRYLPGRLLQASPERDRSAPGQIKVIDLDLSKYDRIASRFRQEQNNAVSYLKGGIDTRNAAFNQLIDRIEQVAIASRDPLLLMGPTGAWELYSRRIFELKKLRHTVTGGFVDVNCATLRGDAAMSALFGHVKGAFTGALKDRAGVLRVADKGVLFLDEIGELGVDEQAMLLRALEEKTFLPLGSDHETHSDFQLIAGTNRDLFAAVHQGRFRENLLARINLWTFSLPGLRSRPEDIEPNLQFELEQFEARVNRHMSFSKEAREEFLRFALSPTSSWARNFRDLNAAVVRMATLAQGGRISTDIVKEEIGRLTASWISLDADVSHEILSRFLDRDQLADMDLFDRAQLTQVINLCQDSRTLSDAGRRLFGASRAKKTSSNDADRLRKYLGRFGLEYSQLEKP